MRCGQGLGSQDERRGAVASLAKLRSQGIVHSLYVERSPRPAHLFCSSLSVILLVSEEIWMQISNDDAKSQADSSGSFDPTSKLVWWWNIQGCALGLPGTVMEGLSQGSMGPLWSPVTGLPLWVLGLSDPI